MINAFVSGAISRQVAEVARTKRMAEQHKKATVRADYDEYVKREIADQWEEKEITI